MKFVGFPKIPRMHAPCIITEKIDGTNAQILIVEGDAPYALGPDHPCIAVIDEAYGPPPHFIAAGSRKRWLAVGDDNFGFAGWVNEHASDLDQILGPGRHFGEWWGQGIQRRYGLGEKRFTSFRPVNDSSGLVHDLPVLYEGIYTPDRAYEALYELQRSGSHAAPGFRDPEGVVVYFPQSHTSFKLTFDALAEFSPDCPYEDEHVWRVEPKPMYRKDKSS